MHLQKSLDYLDNVYKGGSSFNISGLHSFNMAKGFNHITFHKKLFQVTKYLFSLYNAMNIIHKKRNKTVSAIHYGEQYNGVPTGVLIIYSFLNYFYKKNINLLEIALANPKSAILHNPSCNKIFSGLISR